MLWDKKSAGKSIWFLVKGKRKQLVSCSNMSIGFEYSFFSKKIIAQRIGTETNSGSQLSRVGKKAFSKENRGQKNSCLGLPNNERKDDSLTPG